MPGDSRRSFLTKALASMTTLCLPGLPLLQAQPWEQDAKRLLLADLERAFREHMNPFDTPRFTAAVNEAVNKAAIDKAIASDYIIPYRVIPKGL